jgi:hypothetical protein
MRIAYVSGPYRAKTVLGVTKHILQARWVAIRLWKLGYSVVCPHMNTAWFPHEKQIAYINGDLEIISRFRETDCMVMLPGWQNSSGSRAEWEYAMTRKLKIFSWPQDKKRIEQYA